MYANLEFLINKLYEVLFEKSLVCRSGSFSKGWEFFVLQSESLWLEFEKKEVFTGFRLETLVPNSPQKNR